MKKKILFVVSIAMAVIFAACSKDEDNVYSLSDVWLGFGIVTEEAEGSFLIVMDNKDILSPVITAGKVDWRSKFHAGDRVFVNYTILKKENGSSIPLYYVRVNDIDKVLMKGILDITEANEDSIGNNPIIVEKFWITDSLLNFKVKYLAYNKVHFLNLVKQPGVLTAKKQPIKLELRHNKNKDQELIASVSFVSFSLNKIRIPNLDSVTFEFSYTDYKQTKHTNTRVFKYKNLGLPQAD